MEHFFHHSLSKYGHVCAYCGEEITNGEEYYSLSSNHFHSDCLLDNYSLPEALELLGIDKETACGKPLFDPRQITLGKHQNVRLLIGFYDYFKTRFKNHKELIERLSEEKHKNQLSASLSDQAILEHWALHES